MAKFTRPPPLTHSHTHMTLAALRSISDSITEYDTKRSHRGVGSLKDLTPRDFDFLLGWSAEVRSRQLRARMWVEPTGGCVSESEVAAWMPQSPLL